MKKKTKVAVGAGLTGLVAAGCYYFGYRAGLDKYRETMEYYILPRFTEGSTLEFYKAFEKYAPEVPIDEAYDKTLGRFFDEEVYDYIDIDWMEFKKVKYVFRNFLQSL